MNYHISTTEPIQKLVSEFYSMYPGPFAVVPGTDGCDATFDVVCAETRAVIASVHYWEAELRSRRRAEAIARLLNDR